MTAILIFIILILLAVCIFFFMGILAHKKHIEKQIIEIVLFKQRLSDQIKKTIEANNNLLILKDQFKRTKYE